MIIDSNNLTPTQSAAFLEVIDASLRITQREHLFMWLQGSFQSLIAHEVMLCGIRISENEAYYFDSFASTRYFTERHANEVTRINEGVIWQVMDVWQKSGRPVLVSADLPAGDFGDYIVPFAEKADALENTELMNIVAYGMSGHGGISTFFSFSRMPKQVVPAHAYMLELLMPHLHSTLTRVMAGGKKTVTETGANSGLITVRESEILHWLHMGKTNWEIASILAISPLTVKNHVQNILRKLDVKNRSHAAVKAARMGLVKA